MHESSGSAPAPDQIPIIVSSSHVSVLARSGLQKTGTLSSRM
jgi:hypothetical protein